MRGDSRTGIITRKEELKNMKTILNTSVSSEIMHTIRCEFSATLKCRCTCKGYLHRIEYIGTTDQYETGE